MVNVCGTPAQPSNEGVTSMVVETGDEPAFTAVNDGILPLPEDADSPIEVLLLVHEYVVVPPVRLVVKVTAVLAEPLHSTWSAGSVTWPLGFTVMVKACGVPAQPSNEGVTVIVAVTGAVPLLVAVNEEMLPVPLAPRPMLVLLLLHAYVVVPPVRLVLKLTAVVAEPLHRV